MAEKNARANALHAEVSSCTVSLVTREVSALACDAALRTTSDFEGPRITSLADTLSANSLLRQLAKNPPPAPTGEAAWSAE